MSIVISRLICGGQNFNYVKVTGVELCVAFLRPYRLYSRIFLVYSSCLVAVLLVIMSFSFKKFFLNRYNHWQVCWAHMRWISNWSLKCTSKQEMRKWLKWLHKFIKSIWTVTLMRPNSLLDIFISLSSFWWKKFWTTSCQLNKINKTSSNSRRFLNFSAHQRTCNRPNSKRKEKEIILFINGWRDHRRIHKKPINTSLILHVKNGRHWR